MAPRSHGMRALLGRFKTALLLALVLVTVALLLTRCPANRDGMPGQLARAMEETASATRSAAMALDLWVEHSATDQLTSVTLSNSRAEVVRAYGAIAELRAEDPVDVERQRMLTESMTTIISQLNAASAVVRDVAATPPPSVVRDELLVAADALESGYR